jgi:hypothetical protein
VFDVAVSGRGPALTISTGAVLGAALVVLTFVRFPTVWKLTRTPWAQVATFAAVLGWTLGLTFGTLGLLAGLWMAAS